MSQPSANSEGDDIQRQMREVRAELRDNVQDLVTSAQKMGDWTNYVRAYPWLCVGAAAVVGYMVIPSRPLVIHPDPETMLKLTKENNLVLKPEDGTPVKKKGGLAAQLLSMAAAGALQIGLRIATQQLNAAFTPPPKAHSNGRPGVHHA